MSLLCDAGCGAPVLPSKLNDCDLTPLVTSGKRFAFVACNFQFVDITNPVEWASAVASGDVTVSPPGFWSKTVAAQTSFDVTCGEKFQTQEGQQYSFTSSFRVLDTLEDQIFYKDLRANYKGARVIPITCDGQFYVDDEYIENVTSPGVSPGHVFTWITPPDFVINSGENQLHEWQFTLQTNETGIPCSRYLPGVLAVLETN